MDEKVWELAANLVPTTYVRQARDAAKTRQKLIEQLLNQRKLPEKGWDDVTIEFFLNQLSSMDSNNFPANSGMGEREARFASELVARRHFRFGHGIGRSGDLTEPQPKAAGSTLMYKLTNLMLQDLFKLMNIQEAVKCLLVPVATGMALTLCLLSLRLLRPKAKYVLWSRIDQKSCFKSIITAGFTPVVIDLELCGDELKTNTNQVSQRIHELGPDNVLCFISTTSCFAPRACDGVEDIACLCKQYDLPHLVNNAYGLQSPYLMKRIQRAKRRGRVDMFVQSTDKNLLVPVGGAVIASFDHQTLEHVSEIYPGRASASPVIDCFITLLSIGKSGFQQLVIKRKEMYDILHEKLSALAETFGEKVLDTPDNPISIAISLSQVPKGQLTKLGSMLFLRNVSGTRVLTTIESKVIEGHSFKGWGSHYDNYPTPYLTAAATLGVTEKDIELFIGRLKKVLSRLVNNAESDSSHHNLCSGRN